MTGRVLIDAGPIIAAFNRNDSHHTECAEQLKDLSPPLFTCWPVLTEAVFRLSRYPQAIQSLFRSIDAGHYQLLELPPESVMPIAELLHKYHDQGIDLADAALVHLANTHSIPCVFTLDGDFRIYRYQGRRRFEIIP